MRDYKKMIAHVKSMKNLTEQKKAEFINALIEEERRYILLINRRVK